MSQLVSPDNARKRPQRTKYTSVKYPASVASPPTTPVTPSSTLTTLTSPAQTPTPLYPAAKKRIIKTEDKIFPEKLSTFIPESQLYTSLLEFERKLDLALVRRQIDVSEAINVRNMQRMKKLIRLSIQNTYANQTAFYHTDNKTQLTVGDPPSWTLKIEGKLLDDGSYRSQKAPKRKFTSFIKKAFFQLGDDPNNIIEWDKAHSSGETDGWEIKRAGNKEVDVKILLFLEHSPSKVKLSPALASLLNIHTETRPRIIMSLWQYIKAHRLLDPNDHKLVVNDEALKSIFGCDTMQFTSIPQLVREHQLPPDPIEIVYTVSLSGDPLENSAHYEMQVEVDEAVSAAPSQAQQYKRDIATCDENILNLIAQINDRKRKRDFMVEFHTDPIKFMNKLIDNQIRDNKLMHSETGRDTEEERHTQFYYQPYIEDAVQSYLSKHSSGVGTPQQSNIQVHLPTAPTPTPTPPTASTPSQQSNVVVM